VAQVDSLRDQLTQLRNRQLELRTELNALGDQIQAQKARQRAPMPGDPLLVLLERSQVLSTELTRLAGQISVAEESSQKAQQGVVELLGARLEALRKQLEASSDRQARGELISRMRGLRAERERYAAALPRLAGVPSPSSASGDDPEDLLEQADALRDSKDKVQRRLTAVQRRLGELRAEAELEQRMNEFLGEDSLFDESDRQLGRSSVLAAGDVLTPVNQPESLPAQYTGDRGGGSATPAPRHFRELTAEQLAQLPADDLGALEAEQKRLSTLAQELETQARDAERRALQLR